MWHLAETSSDLGVLPNGCILGLKSAFDEGSLYSIRQLILQHLHIHVVGVQLAQARHTEQAHRPLDFIRENYDLVS